jgi:membrane-associated phospholipid phosphatase
LLLTLAVVHAALLAALLIAGGTPVIPWDFLPQLLVGVLPTAYAAHRGLASLAARCANGGGAIPIAGVLAGLAILALVGVTARYRPLAIALAIYSITDLLLFRREQWLAIVQAALAVFLLFGAVWHMNYLIAPVAAERRYDDDAMRLDLAVYGWLGIGEESAGLYPLAKDPGSFQFMQAGYLSYYVEIGLVLFALVESRRNVAPFFTAALAIFLAAGVLFCAAPIIGPYFAYPESIAKPFRASPVGLLMQNMNVEFAAMFHYRAQNGYGYIIGLPSTHAAMAVLLQWSAAYDRLRFWALLPVNAALILATAWLGFHYLVDVAAGLVLAALVIATTQALSRRRIRARGSSSRL